MKPRPFNESLLAAVAVTAIVGSSVVLGPMTRTQTGGQQVQRAESGPAVSIERVVSPCGEAREVETRTLRMSVSTRVRYAASLARVSSGGRSVEIPFDGGSCWEWGSMTAMPGNDACVANCHGDDCLLAVYPRSLESGPDAVLEILDDGGRVLAGSTYRGIGEGDRHPRTSVALADGTLRISPGLPPTNESSAWVSVDGGAPAYVPFRDGVGVVAIPPASRSFEVAVRTRRLGDELTETISGNVGIACRAE